MRASFSLGIFTLLAQMIATPAQAVIETWVSGTGTDSGTCPITAPCRTFAYALTRTNNGGTINVAAPGSFGPVTINKSVSIVAEGVRALINTAADGAAITVQAGATAVVELRGLTIDVSGNDGIAFLSGSALHVRNSFIRRATNGIHFAPASGTGKLYVLDTVISNSGGTGIDSAILVRPTGSANARATIDRVRAETGLYGFSFSGFMSTGSIVGSIRDSVVAGHVSAGVIAEELSAGSVSVLIDRSTLVDNDVGILAGGGTDVRITNTVVFGNEDAWFGNTDIISFGNNSANGNGGEGGAPATTALR